MSSSYATSAATFMYLAENGSAQVLKCIADNHNAPPAALDAISSRIYSMNDHNFTEKSSRTSIIISLTANESSPPSLLERLSVTGIVEARHNIALHHSTPKNVLWGYYREHNDEGMCISLANGANVPPEILEELSTHRSKEVIDGVTRNKNTSSYTLSNILFRTLKYNFKAPMPINEIAPGSLPQEIMVNSRANKFIVNIAGNHNASDDVIELLSKLKLYPVDFALSNNPRINYDISNNFIELYADNAKLLEQLAAHTKFPVILERLSKSNFNNVRSAVAMNSCTQYKVIRTLERDSDSGVSSIAHSRAHSMLIGVAKTALRKMLRSEPREGVIIG